jgi:hypothetical protein
MPTPSLTRAQIDAVMARYKPLREAGYSVKAAAEFMEMPRQTLMHYIDKDKVMAAVRPANDGLVIPTGPNPNEPIEDLVSRKKAQYARQASADDFAHLIPIQVRENKPVAICAVGDPHVDDDLCDIGAIERDMRIIGRTDGMYALHLGDITNNWVGRLGRLYAHQSTKATDAVRLAEWMFKLAPPLALVSGNHDLLERRHELAERSASSRPGATSCRPTACGWLWPSGAGRRCAFTRATTSRGTASTTRSTACARSTCWASATTSTSPATSHTDAMRRVPSPEGFMHQWMLRVSGYKGHDDYAKAGHFAEDEDGPDFGAS